jgi:glyoxylase-like metal-dependent hydrolase (beta-lactamase superfamily II)
MLFRQLFDSASHSYTYLIGDPESGVAALVDPVLEQSQRDLELLAELDLKLHYVLETHVHADHITAAAALRQATGCQGAVPKGAQVACADLYLEHGQTLHLGVVEITALATPGHTDFHMAYRVGADRVLTGDALLIRGCGRTDLQGGDAGRLYDSIWQQLFTLPDATLVYPGHDYRGCTVSTIGEERRFNPRLLGCDRAAFIGQMARLVLPLPQRMLEALPANQQCGDTASVQG